MKLFFTWEGYKGLYIHVRGGKQDVSEKVDEILFVGSSLHEPVACRHLHYDWRGVEINIDEMPPHARDFSRELGGRFS